MTIQEIGKKAKYIARIIHYIADCVGNAPDFSKDPKQVERSNDIENKIQEPTPLH